MGEQADVWDGAGGAGSASSVDGAPEYFFYLLFQASRRRDLAFGAVLEEMGLSLAKWRAILTINRVPYCSMGELSEFTTIDRTTLTRTIDQLVADQLVQRVSAPGDRRQVQLVLTDRGMSAFAGAIDRLRQFNSRALQNVPVAEATRLLETLQAIVRNLSDDPELAESVVRYARIAES